MGQSKVRKSCPGMSGTLRASSITVPHFGHPGRIVSGCKRVMAHAPNIRREHYRTLSHRRLRDGPSASDGAQCALIEQIANHLIKNEVRFSGLPDWQFSWISSFKGIPGLNIKPGEYSTRCGPKDHSQRSACACERSMEDRVRTTIMEEKFMLTTAIAGGWTYRARAEYSANK